MSAPRMDYSLGKRCNGCRETKPVTEFYPRPERRGGEGIESRCKACSNRDRVRGKQTHRQYMNLLVAQCGACAICGETETARASRPISPGKTRGLSSDHDHITGKPRGLLCSRCNTALGLMTENPELLRRAAAYVEEYR